MKILMCKLRLHKADTTNLSCEPIRSMLARFVEDSKWIVRLGSNGSRSLRYDKNYSTTSVQFNVGAKQVLMVVDIRWW